MYEKVGQASCLSCNRFGDADFSRLRLDDRLEAYPTKDTSRTRSEDPRVVGRCDHLLIDIVMIALVATMGDTDDWQEVEMFGRLHQDWFARFLELPRASRVTTCSSGCLPD